jgi:hypothetical protein
MNRNGDDGTASPQKTAVGRLKTEKTVREKEPGRARLPRARQQAVSSIPSLIGLHLDGFNESGLAPCRFAVPTGDLDDGFNSPLLDRNGQLAQMVARNSHLMTEKRKHQRVAVLIRVKFREFELRVGEEIKRFEIHFQPQIVNGHILAHHASA